MLYIHLHTNAIYLFTYIYANVCDCWKETHQALTRDKIFNIGHIFKSTKSL